MHRGCNPRNEKFDGKQHGFFTAKPGARETNLR